jgi:hypothetical protein
MIRLYIGLENIALTGSQKQTLIAALAALGPASDPQPSHLNHRRVRLDGDAVIFEAAFGDNDLTVAALRQYVANVFGVPVAQVTSSTANQTFAVLPTPIVTLSYQATQRLRVALFGGTSATWAQSRTEVAAYLAANAATWGDTP